MSWLDALVAIIGILCATDLTKTAIRVREVRYDKEKEILGDKKYDGA